MKSTMVNKEAVDHESEEAVDSDLVKRNSKRKCDAGTEGSYFARKKKVVRK